MEVTRIIHPVGQGAFYTERLDIDGRIFNVVYDCGSGNLSNAPQRIQREISSYYTEVDDIDILFISHFDNDHINGIKELYRRTNKIRNIVVPLIEREDYWFYQIENSNFLLFYNNLVEFADHIYFVNPSDFYADGEPEQKVLSDSFFNRKRYTIESNARLFLSSNIDWCYIPFNYDLKIRLDMLKVKLESEGISERVFEGDWLLIEQNLDKIKNAYQKIFPDGANKTSLIVYSGGVQGRYNCRKYKCELCSFPMHYLSGQEACLYFGDNDLNQPHILSDLEDKLHLLKDRIGTIQLPHHGALRNFNEELLDINRERIVYFASFGGTNSYGHPSAKVVSDVLGNGHMLYGITERRDSTYIQSIVKV